MANIARLFNTLRNEHDIKSDAALARKLNVAPSDICKARKTGVLTDRMLVHISEQIEMPIKAIRELAV